MNNIKGYFCLAVSSLLLISIMGFVLSLPAQTKIDAAGQLKNISPIITAQRSQCVGNGTVNGGDVGLHRSTAL